MSEGMTAVVAIGGFFLGSLTGVAAAAWRLGVVSATLKGIEVGVMHLQAQIAEVWDKFETHTDQAAKRNGRVSVLEQRVDDLGRRIEHD